MEDVDGGRSGFPRTQRTQNNRREKGIEEVYHQSEELNSLLPTKTDHLIS